MLLWKTLNQWHLSCRHINDKLLRHLPLRYLTMWLNSINDFSCEVSALGPIPVDPCNILTDLGPNDIVAR